MYFVANLGLKELNCARKNQERNKNKKTIPNYNNL